VFERFTERSRQVIVLAQDEARGLGHNYIGTEHILLGLLREEECVAARVLDSLGIDVADIRRQVAEIVGRGEGTPAGQIPFTPRAKRVLELALKESLALGQEFIGTEHILLGLVRETEGVAARILADAGADADRVRSAVIEAVGGTVSRQQGRMPPPWRRRRRRFGALSAARDEALDDGNYDLARKLLELEIEERQKRAQPESESEPAA
jgi:ATP-dependent Clp protease ATP-binding subunit ClpC